MNRYVWVSIFQTCFLIYCCIGKIIIRDHDLQGRDKYGLRHPDWLNFLRDSKSSAAYERRILDFVQWRENAGLLPFETSVSHEELVLNVLAVENSISNTRK